MTTAAAPVSTPPTATYTPPPRYLHATFDSENIKVETDGEFVVFRRALYIPPTLTERGRWRDILVRKLELGATGFTAVPIPVVNAIASSVIPKNCNALLRMAIGAIPQLQNPDRTAMVLMSNGDPAQDSLIAIESNAPLGSLIVSNGNYRLNEHGIESITPLKTSADTDMILHPEDSQEITKEIIDLANRVNITGLNAMQEIHNTIFPQVALAVEQSHLQVTQIPSIRGNFRPPAASTTGPASSTTLPSGPVPDAAPDDTDVATPRGSSPRGIPPSGEQVDLTGGPSIDSQRRVQFSETSSPRAESHRTPATTLRPSLIQSTGNLRFQANWSWPGFKNALDTVPAPESFPGINFTQLIKGPNSSFQAAHEALLDLLDKKTQGIPVEDDESQEMWNWLVQLYKKGYQHYHTVETSRGNPIQIDQLKSRVAWDMINNLISFRNKVTAPLREALIQEVLDEPSSEAI